MSINLEESCKGCNLSCSKDLIGITKPLHFVLFDGRVCWAKCVGCKAIEGLSDSDIKVIMCKFEEDITYKNAVEYIKKVGNTVLKDDEKVIRIFKPFRLN